VVVNAEQTENEKDERNNSFRKKRRSLFKIVFDRADMVRDVR